MGRGVLFLVLTLMLTACGKEEKPQAESEKTSQYNEENWSWDDSSKYTPGGINLDTALEGDTTIYF